MTLTEPAQPTAPRTTVRITVAVCTFRRLVLLERLLRSLDAVATPADGLVDVLVIDNDPDASAADVVGQLELIRPVRYVHEPRPGIAAARNSALSASGESDYIAFIDDDEVPDGAWLATLLAAAHRYEADVVAGPTDSAFAVALPPWIEAGGYFARSVMETGSSIPFAACGNLLLRVSALHLVDHWFDDHFGLTGGEDSEFTARLAKSGARLAWCQEALTIEDVPAERITARWVLHRSCRMGNTAGRMQLVATSWLARPRIVAGGVGRLLAGILSICLSPLPGRPHWAVGLRLACRGAGMIAAGTGVTIGGYRRPRG